MEVGMPLSIPMGKHRIILGNCVKNRNTDPSLLCPEGIKHETPLATSGVS
jgi:hypothetical protein